MQIENEYYGLIRPKQTTQRGEKPTQALKARGIEYIEMRCVDLNPFSPIGIDKPTAHFLEVYALHSVLSDSEFLPKTNTTNCLFAKNKWLSKARAPNLQVTINGQAADFKTHALTLLNEMRAVAFSVG